MKNLILKISKIVHSNFVRWILIAVGCVAAFEYFTLPSVSIEDLRIHNVGVTALMEQRANEAAEASRPFRVAQKWVPLSKISQNVIHAVVVSEDGTFFEHSGFDWYELQESIEQNLDDGKQIRGASTITQQLAKNLYLSTSKNPFRKIKEAIITLRIEEHLSKQRILELYLNIIEWGDGIFGVEAAALKYFGVSAANLSREQASQLAAVIPSPLKQSPNQNSRYVIRRSGIILHRMEARGW